MWLEASFEEIHLLLLPTDNPKFELKEWYFIVFPQETLLTTHFNLFSGITMISLGEKQG